MLPPCFHSAFRYNPSSRINIDLGPLRTKNLPSPRGGQNRKFECPCRDALARANARMARAIITWSMNEKGLPVALTTAPYGRRDLPAVTPVLTPEPFWENSDRPDCY